MEDAIKGAVIIAVFIWAMSFILPLLGSMAWFLLCVAVGLVT